MEPCRLGHPTAAATSSHRPARSAARVGGAQAHVRRTRRRVHERRPRFLAARRGGGPRHGGGGHPHPLPGVRRAPAPRERPSRNGHPPPPHPPPRPHRRPPPPPRGRSGGPPPPP